MCASWRSGSSSARSTIRAPVFSSLSKSSTLIACVAFIRCLKALEKGDWSEGEKFGVEIIRRALEEPLRQIAHNAGLEGSVVVNDVRKAKQAEGLNAATGEIVDLVKAGVIDPAMVTRSALQNAASIAKNILTTEAVVAEAPEKEKAAAGMPDMGGMM